MENMEKMFSGKEEESKVYEIDPRSEGKIIGFGEKFIEDLADRIIEEGIGKKINLSKREDIIEFLKFIQEHQAAYLEDLAREIPSKKEIN